MVTTRSFRLLLTAALTAVMLLPATTNSIAAQPAEPTTSRFHIEELKADFVIPTKEEGIYKWLGVQVKRETNIDTGAVTTSGYPIGGRCEGDETGFNMPCVGRGFSGWKVTRFEADAGMNTALVVMKKAGRKIRMAFTGSTPFPTATSANENACGGTTTDVYTLTRNATAEGKMRGRPVSTATESDGNRATERMSVIERTEECP